jgi:signal transduction histidine kinase
MQGGRWGRQRSGRWRPFGCLVLLLGLFAAGAIFMALWALAAIIGIVDASPVVVGAGIAAFVAVVVGAVLAARLLRSMTRPLDDLVEASQRIEAGDFTTRVAVSGGGGVRSLTRAFNQMSAELQASDERRRVFLADVTHELRTPLTVIGGQLEAIEDGIYEADPERIAALLAQVRQMSRLIEDLHTISLAEVGALRLDLGTRDLNEVAEEIVATLAPQALLKRVDLRLESAAVPVMATLDVDASRRVLANVITNAFRHTDARGTVTVAVRASGGEPAIDVHDTGSGMPPELVELAFERFARGGASSGSGLGLAIARDLVEAQGGKISLASEVGTGTQVRIGFAPPTD